MSGPWASVESGRQRQNQGGALADCKFPKTTVIFLEGGLLSLSDAKSPVHQFMAAQYPADLKEALVAPHDEGASVGVIAGDIDGEAGGIGQFRREVPI